MPCNPFDPQAGTFINIGTPTTDFINFQFLGWDSTTFNKPTGTLELRNTSEYWIRSSGGTPILIARTFGSVNWIWYSNFILLRDIGNFHKHRMWICDLRSNPAKVNEVGFGINFIADNAVNFQHSQDGLLFFLFAANGIENQTKNHLIVRSDTGELLCSFWSVISSASSRGAYVTANKSAKMVHHWKETDANGNSLEIPICECPFHLGKLKVTPDCNSNNSFPEVVIGSTLPGCNSTIKQFTLTNIGNDDLCISAISAPSANSPFHITSNPIPPNDPLVLEVGATAIVEIGFTPTTVGDFSESLIVTATPVSNELICLNGSARNQDKKLDVPTNIAFGDVCVRYCKPKTVRIENNGSSCDLPVTITIPPSTNGAPFQWGYGTYNPNHIPPPGQDEPKILQPGEGHDILINFCPTSNGNFSHILQITSDDPNTHHDILLTGVGVPVIATMEIENLPPANVIDFGEIESGLFFIRKLKIKNTGNKTLHIRACIRYNNDPPFPFFLTAENETLDIGPECKNYDIDPVHPCQGIAGAGEVYIYIALITWYFDITNSPNGRVVSNTLTITPDVGNPVTIELRGKIIAPIPIDTSIVFETSATMQDDMDGTPKIFAAMDAMTLFIKLARERAGDRISIVSFDYKPRIRHTNVPINDASKASLIDSISSLAISGNTCISGGVWIGAEQLLSESPKKTILLLTSGADNVAFQRPNLFFLNINYPSSWHSLRGGWKDHPNPPHLRLLTNKLKRKLDLNGIKFYVIQVGPPTEYDTTQIEELANTTSQDGAFQLTQQLRGEKFFDILKFFSRV